MYIEKIIYLVNVGSSSQKNALLKAIFDENGNVTKIIELLSVSAERLNARGSIVKAKKNGKIVFNKQEDNVSHKDAIIEGNKVVADVVALNKIDYIVNRAVNVGEHMECCYLTEETENAMRQNQDRAPEHNPGALECIEALKESMPNALQVLVPDSAPHASIPKVAYTYAIPLELSEQYHLRKMGFHGSVVSNAIREVEKLSKQEMKCIIAHLGNGCSITCVKDSKVMDTSMGLTPLTGMSMGTRSGDVDPSIIPLLKKYEGISSEEVLQILNKKSGLLGLSGIGSDFRDVLNSAFDGNERAEFAIEIFLYRAGLEISKYVMPINGLNQLVFSGGIGENSEYVREQICDELAYLGVKLDKEKNKISSGKITKISAEDSRVEVFIIPADEQHEMVRQAIKLITKK